MISNTSNLKYRNIILAFSIIGLIFHVWWIAGKHLPLNSEEAQYWLWSKHPDWSYYSKPPLIAYVNYLFTKLLGNTEFGIRFFTVIVRFSLPLIHYNLAKALFKNTKIAFWASITLFAMPHYYYVSTVFTTDTLLLFFWPLCMLYSWDAIQKNNWKYWILSGLALGLGIISKYTMILWVPSFIFAAFCMNKKILKNPRLYVALFIAFIICIPMLYWNITQRSVGAKHIFGLMGMYKPHADFIHSVLKVLAYIGGQILCVTPFLVPVVYTIFRKWSNKTLGKDTQAVNFLIIPLLITWGLFLVLSPQKNEINWSFFAFTSLPLLIGYSFFHFFSKKSRHILLALNFFLILLVLFPSAFDKAGLGSIYPPRVDLFHRQAGWEELGEDVSVILKENRNNKTFIFSDSYHIASELAFYVEGQPQTYCINTGRRMNQFDLWPGIEQFARKNYDGIYVSSSPLPDLFYKSFKEIKLVKIQKRIYRGQEIDSPFLIYYLKGFEGEYSPTKHNGY